MGLFWLRLHPLSRAWGPMNKSTLRRNEAIIHSLKQPTWWCELTGFSVQYVFVLLPSKVQRKMELIKLVDKVGGELVQVARAERARKYLKGLPQFGKH
jgi:hypothetical protein